MIPKVRGLGVGRGGGDRLQGGSWLLESGLAEWRLKFFGSQIQRPFAFKKYRGGWQLYVSSDCGILGGPRWVDNLVVPSAYLCNVCGMVHCRQSCPLDMVQLRCLVLEDGADVIVQRELLGVLVFWCAPG